MVAMLALRAARLRRSGGNARGRTPLTTPSVSVPTAPEPLSLRFQPTSTPDGDDYHPDHGSQREPFYRGLPTRVANAGPTAVGFVALRQNSPRPAGGPMVTMLALRASPSPR